MAYRYQLDIGNFDYTSTHYFRSDTKVSAQEWKAVCRAVVKEALLQRATDTRQLIAYDAGDRERWELHEDRDGDPYLYYGWFEVSACLPQIVSLLEARGYREDPIEVEATFFMGDQLDDDSELLEELSEAAESSARSAGIPVVPRQWEEGMDMQEALDACAAGGTHADTLEQVRGIVGRMLS